MKQQAADSGDGVVPILVRIAGLPAESMETFSSDLCTREIPAVRRLQDELDAVRIELVERLHARIPGSPVDLRRLLLFVKREAFNGRELGRHRSAPLWEELNRLSGSTADRIVALERELTARQAELREAYARQTERENAGLFRLLEDRILRRGIALASPVLVESAAQQGRATRSENRIETSLLRYISRAALKLSPYSTLTRMALGTVRDDLGEGGPRLLGHNWNQRSLVRLKRYSLSQISEMLLRYPPFRDGLTVVLNSSLEEMEPGRYRFLKPAGWELDTEAGRLRSFPISTVKAKIGGRVVSWLRRELPQHSFTYRELIAVLADDLQGTEEAERISPEVEQLLRLGFLRCLWPWASNEGHLEKRLLKHLTMLPQEEGLREVVDRLERLVALEEGFPEMDDPARFAQDIESLLGEIWDAILILIGVESRIPRSRVKKGEIYEDVFLVQFTESTAPEVVEVPATSMSEALDSAESLVRLTHLFHSRHDFLHTLAALMEERWPGRREVGLLDLISAAQPLWREYARFVADSRRGDRGRATFNPLKLERVKDLAQFREGVWEEACRSVRSEAGESRICREALEATLERVPEAYSPPIGACLLLQPADVSGTLWMANRIFEGTGRYGSRFTAVMDDSMRRLYIERLLERSEVTLSTRVRAEFLDLLCTQGDTLNVHAIQTRRVLEIPGEELSPPEVQRLHLTDLRVRLDEESEHPYLVDLAGRRYLPVHLGGSAQGFLPAPLKFLALFGPAETRAVLPLPHERQEGGITVRERLTLGNLVLSRKRWIVPPSTLLAEARGLTKAAAFAAINEWRMALGIPDRVFVIEKIARDPVERFKPQYVDFTSPLFVEIFKSILKEYPDPLKVEEMLPEPEMLPRDEKGRSWGVELLLDSLAFPEGTD